MPKFNNDVWPRYETYEETGKERLTDDGVAYLAHTTGRLLDDLGIDVGTDEKNWTVPRTNIIPRIFIMGRDKNNVDKILDLSSAGIKPGSREFFEQCAMGNVFAYPADQKEPVQLQLTVTGGGGDAKFSYSKPINAETLPDVPAKPVPWYKRAANWLSRGRWFKKEVSAYDKRHEHKKAIADKLKSDGQIRALTTAKGEESAKAEQSKAEREEARRMADLSLDLERATNRKNAYEMGLSVATSVFRPDPVQREDLTKSAERTYALYTQEHFDSLKKYSKEEIDLEKIKFGNSGQSVTPEDFAAVNMYSLMDPSISKEAGNLMGSDPYAIETLTSKEFGMSEKDANYIYYGGINSFYTTDLFIIPPRDSEGKLFKTVTNAGRERTVKAFQSYAKGDRTELGKILADAVNIAADNAKLQDAGGITAQLRAHLTCSEKILGIFEKDPALLAEAQKQGMDLQKFETFKGLAALKKLEADAAEAEYNLIQAEADKRTLDQKTKEQYTKSIVKYSIALSRINEENARPCPAQDEFQSKAYTAYRNATPQQQVQWQEHPEERPHPGPGKIWSDTFSKIAEGNKLIARPLPKTVSMLTDPKANHELDLLADQIVKQEGLGQKTQMELFNGMKDRQIKSFNLADSIIKATETLKNPQKQNEGPQVPAAEKNVSIQDRAKQFEQDNKGPQIIA